MTESSNRCESSTENAAAQAAEDAAHDHLLARRAREEMLVERAKRGDRAAFNEVASTHMGLVYDVAHNITHDHDDSLDVAVETMRRAYSKLGQFRGQSQFGTWLYRIAVRASVDCVKRRAVRERRDGDYQAIVGSAADSQDPVCLIDHGWPCDEFVDLLPDGLTDLSQMRHADRAILWQRIYLKRTFAEIADDVGVSVEAAQSRYYAAIRAARRILGWRSGHGRGPRTGR